ncbi:MAG: hypothetical protein R2799_13805 [Crocinitomicaceae bacterium]
MNQKILPNKRIEIKTRKYHVITGVQENGVEMKKLSSQKVLETIIEKGEDYCSYYYEQEGDNGEPVCDVSLFIEKDNAFIEVKVCEDPVSKAQCPSIELAKSGLEMARTLKWLNQKK